MRPPPTRLKVRRDFLRLAAGRRKVAMPGFVLQASAAPTPGDGVRFGFTASRRVGGAVVRNRARRRLKSLAQEVLLPLATPGWDYVLIARAETATRPWALMARDLADAVVRIGAIREAT